MPVNTEHDDLREVKKQWDVIRDCVAGEITVKKRRNKYLPIPNPLDVTEENKLRYEAYIMRAVFYNVVKRTLGGLVGQIYSREPIIEVPPELEPLKDDATGLGVNLTQLSKFGAGYTVGYGRSGLFVDFPETGGTVTRAELQNGDMKAGFTIFDPKDIINWRTSPKGGRSILSMVVIKENKVISDDGFVQTKRPEYRVLRLTNGVYTAERWREAGRYQEITPTQANGQPFNEIPFTFIGPENNDPDVDEPPLYDLAALNIAHYRNSADYEESCYITGQPTAWFSGLTQQWVDEIFKGKVQMGARAAIPLPMGALAGMIQPNPNTLPFEAMKHKERQMVALGAKLVEPQAVQRTATEASIDQSYETSTLSASADNVSDAFTQGLRWAAQFEGVSPEAMNAIKFELNTEFDLIKLSSNERSALIQEWQAQALSFGEMRANLRRAGIATMPDDEALKVIRDEQEKLGLGDVTLDEPGSEPPAA
jgi:hypothetical protein